jgi:leader peptidase (prepilin peptidase)/N-methyltransferase
VMEAWLVPMTAGLFGLAVGSFLNVCTLRWPLDESVVAPASRCPNCKEALRWRDNVPVLSWLILRAKCRFCSEPISVQYPLVEATSALIWAGVFAVHGPTPEAVRGGLFLWILFGISISDARFYIIPDQFSIGGAVIGVGMSFVAVGIDWVGSLTGAAVGYAALWTVGVGGTWMIKKLSPGRLEEAGLDQAMGGGDIKMMMMVGAFLGVWGVAMTVFMGSVLALVVYGPISAWRKRLIPLGVFLAAAGAISYAWGDQMQAWYLTQIVGLPG